MMNQMIQVSEAAERAMVALGVCGTCATYRITLGADQMCRGCLGKIRASRADLKDRINELKAKEVMVETNQGTYDGLEAVAKVGTGDPRCANRDVYESVGGTRRVVGCSAEQTPGAVIVRLREERGWSTARLARLAGMHSQTVYKIEGGQRAPSLETARRLAAALGVSLAVFDLAEEGGQT